ncbi:MAG: FAD-dependent oxidoreductase [Anaerolineaceae bacterium]
MEVTNTIYDVIIIGGGPAGASAGIYTARAGLKTAILDKGITTGALGITSKIANFPGIPHEISGADLLEVIRQQAISFGAEFIDDKAIGTDLQSNPKTVYGNLNVYTAKSVIIATGSMGRGNRVSGEEKLLGRGVSYCAVCDAAFYKGKKVAVAGSTDEAVEEALYLTQFASEVLFLSPIPEINAPESLVKELEDQPHVKMMRGAVLREIQGEQKVDAIIIGTRTAKPKTYLVDGVFVYLQGGKPITDFLKGQLELAETGCLVVDREYQTAIPGVFAIGDVLCQHIKQAVVAAADGAIAAIAAEKFIRGRKQMGFDWNK